MPAKKPQRTKGRSAYSQALNEVFDIFGGLMDPPEWRPNWKSKRPAKTRKQR
ncbi:MAG TPA: hypothetical protein VIF43_01945 [Patescibacteria group bacterium]|jgi:hypothetical protein